MPSKPTFQTKEEYAYRTLRQSILACEFMPGEKLVIDHLSLTLGISQIPIRAAMQRLQAEGLVQITPHSGAVVSSIAPEKVHEIFTLLEGLEQSAYRIAADKAKNSDLDGLQACLQEMDLAANSGEVKNWSGLNIQFHCRIAEIADMPLLLEFTHRILDEWQRLSNCYFQKLAPLRLQAAQSEHHQILQALRSKDTDQLYALAVTHNRQAGLAYQNYLPSIHPET